MDGKLSTFVFEGLTNKKQSLLRVLEKNFLRFTVPDHGGKLTTLLEGLTNKKHLLLRV